MLRMIEAHLGLACRYHRAGMRHAPEADCPGADEALPLPLELTGRGHSGDESRREINPLEMEKIVCNMIASNMLEVPMSMLYSTTVTAIGGRSGTVRSDDGLLDLALSMPVVLGGEGNATNPEQLFAAGYAACFGNAVIHVTRNKQVRVEDGDVEVVATVGMAPNDSGGFSLTVGLDVGIAGVDQETAEVIVAEAHKACPYSNAVRSNIDVLLSVRAG